MAEPMTRMTAAPCQPGPGQQAAEETRIQILKNTFQIVEPPLRRFDKLAPAGLTQQVRFFCNQTAGHISPVMKGMLAFDWFAVHFGQQDMGEGPQHPVWRALQQIRKAHVQFPVSQADVAMYICEGIKLHR